MLIAVTGAAGYIGEELCSFLLKQGHDLIQIDTKFDSPLEYIPEDKAELLTYADCIVHLAAISGIQACEDNPTEAALSNTINSIRLMQFASDRQIPMIFASSAAADNPTSSFYAASKFNAEQMAHFLNSNYDANINVLRFSNVYGGDNYINKKNSVVAKFVRQYLKGEPLLIDGTGTQTRDFIHVKRVVEVINRVINEGNIPEKLDVCSTITRSINDVVGMFPDDARIGVVPGERSVGVASVSPNVADMWQLMGNDWSNKNRNDLEDYLNSVLKRF